MTDSRLIPIPADFAANAGLPSTLLSTRYGVAKATISKWRKNIGMKMRRGGKTPRPMPAGFVEIAAITSDRKLCDILDADKKTVARWRKEAGLEPFKVAPRVDRAPHAGSFKKVPVPADFLGVAGQLNLEAVMGHYGRGRKLVKRWYAETGAKMVPYRVPSTKAPAKARQPGLSLAFANAGNDGSLAFRAGEFLRRRDAVWRCDERGQQNPKGSHWYTCGKVLTAEALVDRAKGRGWEPDAWKRLAT